MDKQIYIITVNWNRAEETKAFLDSFSKLTIPKGYQVKITVVDNGSTEKFKIQNPKFQIIRNDMNLGFAGGE